MSDILTLFSEGLVIDPCNGEEIIDEARDVFWYIDSEFGNLFRLKKPTKETKVNVYELQKDATFKQIFESIDSNLERLCLTQAQIINFIRKHGIYFRNYKQAIIFLLNIKKEFLVVIAALNALGGFDVILWNINFLWDINSDLTIYGNRRWVVVIPQLS